MNKEYSIFDPEDRPGGRNWDDMDSVYNHPDNNWFMFLNECPGEFGAFCRSRIHTWLNDMPDGGRDIANNLVPRKGGRKYEGDGDDYKFRSRWWEMFVHQIFKHRAASWQGEVSEEDSKNIDFRYQMPDGSTCLVECCILTEIEELLKIASLKTEYTNCLLPVIEGSKVSAQLTTFSDYYPHSENALQIAAKLCLNNPMRGKAEITSSEHHELISTDSIKSYKPSSALYITPSKTGDSDVYVSIGQTHIGDSRHLAKLENKLQKKQIQKLENTPFILAATTNLADMVFDPPAVYRKLYRGENALFSDQRWDKVSAVLLGSPLPHYLDYQKGIPLTLFLNPYASNPVPKCLLDEMPYVVDSEQEQMHHDIYSSPIEISRVRKYLKSEDFDEWDRLRDKDREENNATMLPSLSPQATSIIETIKKLRVDDPEQGIQWLEETDIFWLYDVATKRLPWGGTADASIEIVDKNAVVLNLKSEKIGISLNANIPHKTILLSISLVTTSEMICTEIYDHSLHNLSGAIIKKIHSVLNPEQERKLHLRWLPKSKDLTEEAIDAVNKVMSLYLKYPRIPKPEINLSEENLKIVWRGGQRFLHLSCYLIDKTAEWFDTGTHNIETYKINNLEKWKELEKHLLSITAPQQFRN